MRTRLPVLLLFAIGPVVAAQGPLTSSLVEDPNSSLSTTFTTVLTTVIVTNTSVQPPITLTSASSTTTTTVVLPPSPPETTTTTIHTDSHSSSSSDDPSNVQTTHTPSGTLVSPPTGSGSDPLTHNPGALAGLIIGLCVVVAGLVVFAWFTIKRHRLRELETQALDQPAIGGVRWGVPPGEMPSGYGPSRTIDDDPDLEAQSSVEHEMRSSSTGHGIVSSMLGGASHGETPERDEYEGGYLARAASSNGHSSHGHVTIHTRNSSLTQIYPSIRNTSPTLSRQVPNRARFSLSPERNPVPTAWNTSRSEAPTRRGSIDDMSTVSYNLHRVSSEPAIFHDGPQRISIYSRRQSSEYPRPEVFPHPGPPILIHTPPPNPPSSLLRPPSATQVPTLQTLQRSQPSGIYLDLPFVSEPLPSPGASTVSVLSGREGLLGTPPHHPTESLSSLRDDRDYSRRISVGMVSGLRDSASVVGADSDSEVHTNPDSARQHSALG